MIRLKIAEIVNVGNKKRKVTLADMRKQTKAKNDDKSNGKKDSNRN